MQSVFREVSLKFQFADPAVFVVEQCCKCEFVPAVCVFGQCWKCEFVPAICVVGQCWKCECFPAVCVVGRCWKCEFVPAVFVLDSAASVNVFPLLDRALLHRLCQCGHICLVLNQG